MSLPGLDGGLGDLPRLRDAKRKRFSSYDRSGGNKDYVTIPAGETVTLAEVMLSTSGLLSGLEMNFTSENWCSAPSGMAKKIQV
jgi:hypothetical protein